MAERGELDLTGAKQNTGVWLVKVSREPRGALPPLPPSLPRLRKFWVPLPREDGRCRVRFLVREVTLGTRGVFQLIS